MDGYEVLKELRRLIEVHVNLGCSIHQAGYKDDYFKLFKTAHDAKWFDASATPRLTGEAIREYFFSYWLSENNEMNTKMKKILLSVLNMWDEWHYALTQYDLPSDTDAFTISISRGFPGCCGS